MDDRQIPNRSAVAEALAQHLRQPAASVQVLAVEDLSPRLGQAAVLRVTARAGDGRSGSWVIKLPGWGQRSLLELSDPMLHRREICFLRSGIAGALPPGLRPPAAVGVVESGGAEWIVMGDMSEAFARTWTPGDADLVAERLAQLHQPVAADPELLGRSWLEREGFAAYAHHVQAGHENLEALRTDERLAGLLSQDQVRVLHACLEALPELVARAGELTQTLVHGDLHVRNLGLTSQRDLVLIDWEHAGAGPVGVDLATFVGLYRLFGGEGRLDEEALLSRYATALSTVAGRDLGGEVRTGFAVSHLTWGLHLRVGPGLSAIRQGVHGPDPAVVRPHLEDIREGCLRAVHWAHRVGVKAGRR